MKDNETKSGGARIRLAAFALASLIIAAAAGMAALPHETAWASPETAAYGALQEGDWTDWGDEVEWAVDGDDALWIRPKGEAGRGTAAEYIESASFDGNYLDLVPWGDRVDDISAVKVPDGKTVALPKLCGGLFSGCYKATGIDTANLDSSQVESMRTMFAGCSSLTTLDLSGFDTSKVSNMDMMFIGCSNLTSIPGAGSFDTSKVTSMTAMFNSSKITELDLSGYDTSSLEVVSGMFGNCASLQRLDLSGWDMRRVQLDGSGFSGTFSDCRQLEVLDLSNWRIGASCENMIGRIGGLTSSAGTAVDVSGWDLSSVTSLQGLFANASASQVIGIPTWRNTSGIRNAIQMFSGCRELESLDLTGLDLSGVSEAVMMFSDSPALKTIYVSAGTDWSSIETAPMMFERSTSLVGGAGTAYDSSNTGAAYAKVDGGPQDKGYFTASSRITAFHTMEASAAASLDGISYTVSFAPVRELSSSQEAEGGRAVPAGIGEGHLSFSPATDAPLGGSTEYTEVFSSSAPLEDLLGDPDGFGLPGVYFFDVSESHSGGSSGDAAKWEYGGESYRLRVYVANDGQGGLAYTAAEARSTAGGVESAEKSSSLAFTSSHIAWQTLTVSKEVEGAFGNTAYDFPFRVTLFLPEWYDTADAIALSNATEESSPAQAGGAGPFAATYRADLRDGESATFTVPVGTYYKVDEMSVSDAAGVPYEPVIEWSVSRGGASPSPAPSPATATNVNWRYDGDAKTLYISALKGDGDGYSESDGVMEYNEAEDAWDGAWGGYQLPYAQYPHGGYNNYWIDVRKVVVEDPIVPASMAGWFCEMGPLAEIEGIGNIDTSLVSSMEETFSGCWGLTSLDLSGWDVSGVSDMSHMFEVCDQLGTVWATGDWLHPGLVSSGMFNGCDSLVGGNGTAYSAGNADASYAHVDAGASPGYFTAKS